MSESDVTTFSCSGLSKVFLLDWKDGAESEFDSILKTFWLRKMKEGCFRYPLKIADTKLLRGKHGFLGQLNVERATNRRKPEEFHNVKQPFDNEKFNFTKIKPKEIMFRLENDESQEDYLVINVSPLELGHCLVLPGLYERLPQILTTRSLKLAVALMLISRTPAFRIGFNGLCAYATVNHLHLHTYYLDSPMLLEFIDVEHLSGHCYQIVDYPAKGYVFQILNEDEIPTIINDIFVLTSYLVDRNIAHNVYFTRGLRFERSAQRQTVSERDCLRIYVWARTSSTGVKELDAFNPATCELFGHLVIKSEEAYNTVTEESVADILSEITSGPFIDTKEEVRKLYCD